MSKVYTMRYKDIRKSEFVAKTQFLSPKLNECPPNIKIFSTIMVMVEHNTHFSCPPPLEMFSGGGGAKWAYAPPQLNV